jgi:hypothetical protein
MMARQIADAKVRGRRADNVEPDVFWRLLSRDTRK